MINPNRDTTKEVLVQLRDASYERFRIELLNSVEKLLEDFDMSWDDLAEKLDWDFGGGEDLKLFVGGNNIFTLGDLNDIAHVFSAEPYLIFRPRFPWTAT